MDRWCYRTAETRTQPGDFTEARLLTRAGEPVDSEARFTFELSTRVLARYESVPVPTLLSLEQVQLESPSRTKHFYRRLFDGQGAHTPEFVTWASESLVVWMEQTLENNLHVRGGDPHNSDPAFDALGIFTDESDVVRMRLIQVKATESQLQSNCAAAVVKFGRLVKGDYDSELTAKLQLLEEAGNLPPGVSARELMYDPERRYRTSVLHAEDRDSIALMTRYDQYVPGAIWRRSARFVPLKSWDSFWEKLAEVAYAQLA